MNDCEDQMKYYIKHYQQQQSIQKKIRKKHAVCSLCVCAKSHEKHDNIIICTNYTMHQRSE